MDTSKVRGRAEQKTAIGQLLYHLPALMSFPFIFVPHSILDKAEKSHVRGMLKVRVALTHENCKAQVARVWADQTCGNDKNHRAHKVVGTFDW